MMLWSELYTQYKLTPQEKKQEKNTEILEDVKKRLENLKNTGFYQSTLITEK